MISFHRQFVYFIYFVLGRIKEFNAELDAVDEAHRETRAKKKKQEMKQKYLHPKL